MFAAYTPVKMTRYKAYWFHVAPRLRWGPP